jgi:hypothetical protein
MAKTIHRFGCTAIERDEQDTIVLHMGARGHTEDRHVRPAVDALLGKGAFGKIRPFARWERDRDGVPHRQPDLIYAFRLSNELFDSLLTPAAKPAVRTGQLKIAA